MRTAKRKLGISNKKISLEQTAKMFPLNRNRKWNIVEVVLQLERWRKKNFFPVRQRSWCLPIKKKIAHRLIELMNVIK